MYALIEVPEKDLVPGRVYQLCLEMGDKQVLKKFWVIFSGIQPDGNLLLVIDDHSYPLGKGQGRFYQ